MNGAGFHDNFAWGTLVIDPGATLDLTAGSGDALYVNSLQGLDVSGDTVTNIDGAPGLFVYYDSTEGLFLHGDYKLTGGGELIAMNATNAIPEPSTWTMMLIGCVGLGIVGYRASRRTATAAQAGGQAGNVTSVIAA